MNWKTIFNILGWAISITLAIVLFLKQEKRPGPAYAVIKSPSLIFDSENSSPRIMVLVEDSLIVKNNVYVTTIAIWNKGNEEINHESVRSPFYIFCNDTIGDILEHKIIQTNDTIESNFTLMELGDSLQLKWDYFDPDYGCKIQVIYSGNDSTSLICSGKVGRHQVKKVIYLSNDQRFTKITSLFVVSASVLMILFIIYMWINYPTKNPQKLLAKILSICFFVFAMLFWFFMNKDAILSINIPF